MKILVTGAGGYLGGALARTLIARGDRVSTLQRGTYPVLEQMGAEVHTGDLADEEAVVRAGTDCDAVLHVAGLTGVWGHYDDYYRTNVLGTKSIITACRKNRIGRLIYTSTPSVVFDGRDAEGINESTRYPDRYLNHYQATKALAEQQVLAANNDNLATLALRPHLIWGPHDPHLVARIIDRARRGRLRLVKGENLVDTTYIDNAVAAHLSATAALHTGAPCAGKAYFISNGEPLPMTQIINRILAAADLPPVNGTLSPGAAYCIGLAAESIYTLFAIKKEPLLTRFVARQLSCAHWFDIGAARRDLGYEPGVSIDEGMLLLEQSVNHQQ